MKRIIDGKKYDTDTARFVASDEDHRGDFRYWCEDLYCKRTGEYFLYGEGGPMSKYAKSCGCNSWTGSEAIVPLTESEARKWAEHHMSVDAYEAEFGEVEE